MSTAKRSRLRHSEGRTPSSPPASKRLKTTNSSHVPPQSNLNFLVDADVHARKKLTAKLTNGVPASGTSRLDESHAVVAPNTVDGDDHHKSGIEVIDISSAEDESDDSPDVDITKQTPLNGHMTPDEDAGSVDNAVMDGVESTGVKAEEASHAKLGAAESEEPTLGDMLRTRHPEVIDVQASFANTSTERSALIPVGGNRGLAAPSGTSLSTVLTQALKTNDRDLLESCFQVHDMQSVQGTIERLSPPLVVSLLQKLAERIHKRPGRTQKLMIWIQWSLVVHGGYLASQPDVMKQLRSLSQVVRERASGLQSLLHLKGKLDLLWAQLDFQKRQREASRMGLSDDDADNHVIYIDGRTKDVWSDEEELATVRNTGNTLKAATGTKTPKTHSRAPPSHLSDSEDDVDNEIGEHDGMVIESDDEEDEDEDEDDDDDEELVDVEAEETDNDDAEDEIEGDSDRETESDVSGSEDEDEDLDDGEDEDDEVAVKPPQPATLNRKR